MTPFYHRIENRDFWRARAQAPRAITFIQSGRNLQIIAPPDVTEDEVVLARHQAALRQGRGVCPR